MEKLQDLTQGALTPRLVQLAAPLIVENIFQQLHNTIDAPAIGRFAGRLEFAAIGVAGAVMNVFLGVLYWRGQRRHKDAPDG